MSLAHTARINGYDPYAYLKDVFERLPSMPASRIEELLPHTWRTAAAWPPSIADTCPCRLGGYVSAISVAARVGLLDSYEEGRRTAGRFGWFANGSFVESIAHAVPRQIDSVPLVKAGKAVIDSNPHLRQFGGAYLWIDKNPAVGREGDKTSVE